MAYHSDQCRNREWRIWDRRGRFGRRDMSLMLSDRYSRGQIYILKFPENIFFLPGNVLDGTQDQSQYRPNLEF